MISWETETKAEGGRVEGAGGGGVGGGAVIYATVLDLFTNTYWTA